MIFKTELFKTTWDTWVYHHDGIFYLYYLITETSPGEGFGVATSFNGVHWVDHGKQIGASDEMVVYLGTGSVWKSPSFNTDKTFICNYSEWREEDGKNFQNILFATSKDLIHWEKLGDDKMFKIDREQYKTYEHDGGRWDCIFPLEKPSGGYYGYFTATPKNYMGCGLAESSDGINWSALTPPRFAIEEKGIKEGLEAGAVCFNKGKYYSIMGTYCNEYGMAVVVSDDPGGDFIPQEKNFALLSNGSFMHAYFMRMFNKNGETLVNHHSCTRPVTEYNRWTTYVAPFKKVVIDKDDILRLKWWQGNEALKGELMPPIGDGIYEGELISESLELKTTGGIFKIQIENNGNVSYISEYGKVVESPKKNIDFPSRKFKLLVKNTMTELYVGEHFITCYTLENDFISLEENGINNIKKWSFNL